MTIQVELIYDPDCPNAQRAREVLLQAFAGAAMTPSWTEWDRTSQKSPSHVRRHGSPTILVNGRDVAEHAQAECADACRIYGYDAKGVRRVPPVASIVGALRSNGGLTLQARPNNRSKWWPSLSSLPGVGAALLPVGGCPACWPVYSGVLAAFGITFLLNSAYLFWISSALLCLALFALAYGAGSRRGYLPFILGTVSAGVVLFFKFARAFDPLVYVGLLGLVVSALWNAWPKRQSTLGACPRCTDARSASD